MLSRKGSTGRLRQPGHRRQSGGSVTLSPANSEMSPVEARLRGSCCSRIGDVHVERTDPEPEPCGR